MTTPYGMLLSVIRRQEKLNNCSREFLHFTYFKGEKLDNSMKKSEIVSKILTKEFSDEAIELGNKPT